MYNWYDENNGVMVQYMSLPEGIDGACVLNPDGTYTVIISTQICESRQIRAYDHELSHIKGDDFWKADVQEIEHNAHRSA